MLENCNEATIGLADSLPQVAAPLKTLLPVNVLTHVTLFCTMLLVVKMCRFSKL